MNNENTRYKQAKNYILNGISQGLWIAGERVPSENELVDLCNVSRMTARRALQELYSEGTVIRIKGKGSFVAQEKQQASLLQIRSIAAEIRDQGLKHHPRLIFCSDQLVDPEISLALQLNQDQQCGHTQLLHYKADNPIQLEYRWVNLEVIPDYSQQDFNKITPSEYLTSIAPVTEAEHRVEAIIGSESIRQLLQIETKEAVLLLHRTTWCSDKLVSYAKLYHPGDRYSLGTKFQTINPTF